MTDPKYIQPIIEELRSSYFALSPGKAVYLGTQPTVGTARIDPSRVRTSLQKIQESGPASQEFVFATDDPLPLILNLRSQVIYDTALITVENAEGQTVEVRHLELRGKEGALVPLLQPPPNGRVIVTGRAPLDVQYTYSLRDGPGFTLPAQVMPDLGGSTATAFVVDVSGSMSEGFGQSDKITAARAITGRILGMIAEANRSGAGEQLVSLIPFSSDAIVMVPMGGDVEVARRHAADLRIAGGTNIGEALLSGYAELMRSSAPNRTLVLLTDGMPAIGLDRTQILAFVAPLFRQQGIKIVAIGVGDPGNLDASFLQALAGDGRGGYFSAEDQFSLDNAFYDSYHDSLGHLIAVVDGEVAAGQTAHAGSFVVGQSGPLDATLNWPGSDLELILVDPKGRSVTDGYPGARWESRGRPRHLVVEYPLPGTWSIRVKGIEVPVPQEPFHVSIAALPAPGVAPAKESLALALVILGGIALTAWVLKPPA